MRNIKLSLKPFGWEHILGLDFISSRMFEAYAEFAGLLVQLMPLGVHLIVAASRGLCECYGLVIFIEKVAFEELLSCRIF